MITYQLHGQEDLRLEEVVTPPVGPTEVKVRVAHNGICGSDLHYYYLPDGIITRPRFIGHEFSGIVAEVGAEVKDIAVGDRVCVFPIISCGSCSECRSGYPVLCEVLDRDVSTVGCGAPIGALSEYCVVPGSVVVPLPDDISLAQGAMVEPLAVGATAVQRSGARLGQRIAVLGGGPIGIGVALALNALGIDDVVVVEPSEQRRALLAKLTTAQVLDPEEVTADARFTAGGGADIVFECAGVPASLYSAYELAGKRGHIVLIGLHEKPSQFPPPQVFVKEVTVVGHNGSNIEAFHTVIDWMQNGLIPTEGWVTHVPWTDVVTHGLEPLRRGELLKVLIDLPA
ncbi:alcohol dehydrogenase catalytic domain-containing protein [Streptomyces sp. DT2A-34]|uniref:alcohol dehydrogenase catalytic domain-containing protein n=1 Tax=Streptomyces sp. DT2A-34 TaxID=3051182 RepID=UPI00265BFF54|nr:alcohol dehydrogenase catalytic domain-containing protein [Streptomyces sp. DT2A-34]MDO0916658.1 alcohol dehydrogenase catalytic domain-containing protein [Streptomyces sp. DT2A-34]